MAKNSSADKAPIFTWLGKSPNFWGIGESFDSEEPPTLSLTTLLGIDKENLKPHTQEMLDSLRDNEQIMQLRSGFYAYIQFQDILDISLEPNAKKVPLNRHYCYYESLAYLRESIVSCLDKNVLAGMVLLRPFLELAMLDLYWYLRGPSKGYAPFQKWLEGQAEKPAFRNSLEEIFRRLPTKHHVPSNRMNLLQDLLYKKFKGLSTYNHSPTAQESITTLSARVGNISIDSFFYFLATLNILLRQIIFLYVLAYPMSMFPVERYKKWGVNSGLHGLFFDQNNFTIVQTYLGKTNTDKLKRELKSVPQVTTLLELFDSQPDLSESQLEDDWQQFVEHTSLKQNIVNKLQRIATSKAYRRSLEWASNYPASPMDSNQISDQEMEILKKRVENW